MPTSTLVFEKITLLEWEDGPVRVIAESGTDYYLIALAALDVATQQKIFVVLGINRKVESLVFAKLHGLGSVYENWDAFNAWFNQYLVDHTGSMSLIQGELTTLFEYEVHPLKYAALSRLEGYTFEKTMLPENIAFWRKLIA